MKATHYKGKKEQLTSDISVIRSLPNPHFEMIGSIAFLDHVVEQQHQPKTPELPDGSFAHPHRGIATFSYILEGGVHHLDSNGGEGIVYSGGVQWMKAGNGIIHDEFIPFDFQKTGGIFHGLQFWINLPAKNKAENPAYMAVQGEDVPETNLPEQAGKLRVLLGKYGDNASPIPTYLDQFMYHIRLNPGKSATLPTNKSQEYGVYVIKGQVTLDKTIKIERKEVAKLSDFNETITLSNPTEKTIDLILFGGEPYTETTVFYGPFIMNHSKEIIQAFTDQQKGLYGTIDYSTLKIEATK